MVPMPSVSFCWVILGGKSDTIIRMFFLRSIPVTFKTGKIVHSLTDTFYIHFALILRYLWVDTFKVTKSKSCD